MSTVGRRPGGRLNVALLTREYPPEVYGGAGVHVEYLARELSGLVDLTVHCQGADRPGAVAHRPGTCSATRTPRCGRSPPTCPWPRPWAVPTSSTRTPGTRTWLATSHPCCTVCRTWSPRTRWR